MTSTTFKSTGLGDRLVAAVLDAPPPLRRLWRTLLAAMLAVVTWLALEPAPPEVADLGWDKLNHLCAFAALAWVAAAAFAPRWRTVAAGLLAYGVVIELLQAMTPTRSAEAADVLADALGLALGLGLFMLARRWVVALRPQL